MARRREGRHRVASLDASPELAAGASPALRLPDIAAVACDRDAVERAVAGLSAELRGALLLREVEGFSAREVAEINRISVAAAEKRIGRARLRFRARYNDALGEPLVAIPVVVGQRYDP